MSERISNVPIIPINSDMLTEYCIALTGSNAKSNTVGLFDYNNKITLNGQNYVLKNVESGNLVVNLSDVVAASLAAGYDYQSIDKAIGAARRYATTDYDSIKEKQGLYYRERVEDYDTFFEAYNTVLSTDNTKSSVAQAIDYSIAPSIAALADTFNEANPNLQARIIIGLDSAGTKYTYTLHYKGLDGKEYKHIIDPSLVRQDGTIEDATLNTWLRNEGLDTVLKNSANVIKNAQADRAAGDAVLKRIAEGGFKNANAFNDLTAEDRAAITAALPSTEDLTAWNQTKDSDVFSVIIKNLQRDNPKLLERIDYDTLKNISDTIVDEQQSITERSINDKRANLLKAIAQDPELYNKITQQTRADNAAGTIAGQRAANVQGLASEVDAKYDEQAAELYKSLFSGEGGNVAQQTYAGSYNSGVSTLDTIIQGKLDDAVAKENLRASQITEIEPMLQAIADATGIDVARWADAIAENQAEAGGKADSLVSKVQGDLTTAQSDNRANVSKVQDLLRDESSTATQAINSGMDFSDALQKYIDGIGKKVDSGYYKTVNAGDYKKAEQFANKQYSDLITSPEGQEFLKWILDSNTVDAFTKKQTLEEYIKSSELADFITLSGLTEKYKGLNEEATDQANQIFNQAQRAYIAAIAAGDAKTAEQLTRLATTAGTSKGNLYAATALANQFKQQAGSNTGRQLATDFLNQQSFNRANEAQYQYDAANTQLKYLGSGNQQSGGSTLYEAFNKNAQNKAQAINAYGKFGSSVMGSNQDMSSWSVKNNIDNWNRLNQVIKDYNAINAAGAAANTEAQGAIETLAAQAKAKIAGADQILNK